MKKNIILIVASALIFLIIGILIGVNIICGQKITQTVIKPGDNQACESNNISDQDCWDKARQRLMEAGYYSPISEDTEIFSLEARVENIAENKLKVKTRLIDPFDDLDLINRTVIVGENTKIYTQELKNQDAYEKEINEYNKKQQEILKRQAENKEENFSLQEELIFPEPIIKKETDIEAVKAGIEIVINAEENIRSVKEFIAAEILIHPNLAEQQ